MEYDGIFKSKPTIIFGLFKKPDVKKTNSECFEVRKILSDRDEQSSALKILKYAKGLSQQCSSSTAALATIGQFKQGVIK